MFAFKSISDVWIFRLIRWAYGILFIIIGFLYNDAWAAFIFGGIFIITSFFKPTCGSGQCVLNNKQN